MMKKQSIRSLLFVPAQPQKLEKIMEFEADAFVVDLEDSIKPEDKERALKDLKQFLRAHDLTAETIFVRINADRMEEEIDALKTTGVDGFMLPKFEQAMTADKLKNRIANKKIIALVETPMGLVNLREIAAQSGVWGIAFGGEDYCCETGTKSEERYLLPIKTEFVKFARAYNKKCFDTITLELEDSEKIRSHVLTSRNIGFDGKLAIHPNQVSTINEIYGCENIDYMKKILQAFEACSTGVLVFEGKIYEKPHIEKIRQKLESFSDYK